MNLKKISDAGPKRNWKGTLTGGLTEGKPTEQNLEQFQQALLNHGDFISGLGSVKVKGNSCLAVKLTLPSAVKIDSLKEDLKLIGGVEKNGAFIGYYRPESGFVNANATQELE